MLTAAMPIRAVGMAALLAMTLVPWERPPGAAPARGGLDLIRRASSADAASLAELEGNLDALFSRKDLATLDAAGVRREAERLLGVPLSADLVRWAAPGGAADGLRTLTVDFGELMGGPGAGQSFVSYAVVDRSSAGAVEVFWYHDLGKRLTEQGNRAWHPQDVILLSPREGRGGRSLLFLEGLRPSGPVRGILVLQERGGSWATGPRLAPAADARLLAAGPGGAVFEAPREPPVGVLSGAPADLFRSLVLYEAHDGILETDPVIAPIPDPVSAAEALLASLREGNQDDARRRCASPEVLGALEYFSSGWKGGGRVVGATKTELEFVYEERGRPTLRLRFRFTWRTGGLLLESATGRSENQGG